MDSPAAELHAHAVRHRESRQRLYDDIDQAVADAHAELEQERAMSDVTNPEMFADHARPDENAATNS